MPTKTQLDLRQLADDTALTSLLDAVLAGAGAVPTDTATEFELPRKPSDGSELTLADAELRASIEAVILGGGPRIVFQPVVALETGSTIGAEALSRFAGPLTTRGWFSAARHVGLGCELELSAIDAALGRLDAVTWQRMGWNFVGLNVSPVAMFDPRFGPLITQFPTERIVVELADEHGIPNRAALQIRFDALRRLGVRIAVNAVQCTPAGVHRAMEFEPEIIKLSVEFTAALVQDPFRRDELGTILDQCRRHGVFVIAVGAEQPDQLTTLRDVGIDAAQGHVFGLPGEPGSP